MNKFVETTSTFTKLRMKPKMETMTRYYIESTIIKNPLSAYELYAMLVRYQTSTEPGQVSAFGQKLESV